MSAESHARSPTAQFELTNAVYHVQSTHSEGSKEKCTIIPIEIVSWSNLLVGYCTEALFVDISEDSVFRSIKASRPALSWIITAILLLYILYALPYECTYSGTSGNNIFGVCSSDDRLSAHQTTRHLGWPKFFQLAN